MDHLKHKPALLQQLSEQLRIQGKSRISNLEVCIKQNEKDDGYTFDLVTFVDHLANDLYWDERGNWSDCSLLVLRSF